MTFKTETMMNNTDSIIQIPEKLKGILDKKAKLSVQVQDIAIPFSDILKTNDLPFFKEYTDHGIKHIENTLQFAENLIAEETFKYLTPEEVGVLVLSVILHDIGMHTNGEMFKNMIEGKYDNLVDLFPDGKTWKELWDGFLYDCQYWDKEKKNNVFGNPKHIIQIPDLTDLQTLDGYDKKLIGEFIRIHHCRIAHEVSINGYIGENTIPFQCKGLDSEYIKIAGIVARSHGMDVRDTFDYLESLSGDRYTPFNIHAVYLMVLLRLADYLQIDSSRTNENVWSIKYMYSPYSRLEHKTHESIKNVTFTNPDKEKIAIQAHPEDAQTYVKIEWLTNDIQKEFDRSWAILGEVYTDYNYKLRYRRITTNISNKKYKSQLTYVPQRFGFRYNNDLFKLLIAPLYGDDPSYGVRELVQNAVDACRLCIDDLPTKGGPHVKVEVDSNNMLFTITDMGKGMNLYDIENYFLTIGSSYNENIDWKKTRDQNHLYRTGRFGIGVLAAFLLGPEIRVVTKKRGGKEGGYSFKASLNAKFIQIEKEPNAEYGTRIEINCDESCIERLRKNSEWYHWYIDEIPKVEYFFDGELKDYAFDSKEYKELKFSSENFGSVYWKPYKFNTKVCRLYCNGFRICAVSNKSKFSLIGSEQFEKIHIPSLQVTDVFNQLPLNLTRNNIEANVKYDFEEDLAKEVFVDILCQLMATDVNSLFNPSNINSFNFHTDGFSLRSNYINNCAKIIEKGIIRLYSDSPNFSNSKEFYVWDDFFKSLKNSDYFIQFGDEKPDNVNVDDYMERLLSKSGRRRTDDEQRQVFQMIVDGYFAVLDDNTRQKQILKQMYDKIVHFSNGWLIFAPYKSIVEKQKIEGLVNTIITNRGVYPTSKLLIQDIRKHTNHATFIDIVFKNYMDNNPVVPYEMRKRKKKFPKLFEDYSEIIEQYRNKKD